MLVVFVQELIPAITSSSYKEITYKEGKLNKIKLSWENINEEH
jgi:hypothetical protein